jgi:hypothetical protein
VSKSGYNMICRRNPITRELVSLHEHVFIYLLKEGMWQNGICSTPEGFHVHHVDFNKTNNDPENLVILSHSEHRKIHSDKEQTKKISDGLKRNYQFQSIEQKRARTAKAKEKQMELSANTPATPAMLFALSKARVALKEKRDAARLAREAIVT